MKAEQRKELETNTLADKMGRAMKRVQTSPRRTFVFYLVLIGIALIAMLFFMQWRSNSRQEESQRWYQLYDGSGQFIEDLATNAPTTFPGKAARFQKAWIYYWEMGVKKVGDDPKQGLLALDASAQLYQLLLDDCKDDPMFEPQALLGLAVVEEDKAIQAPRVNLEKAKERYEAVVEKYPESVQGKFAQERVKILKDAKERAKTTNIYEDLQRMLNVRPLQAFNARPDIPEPFKKDEKPGP